MTYASEVLADSPIIYARQGDTSGTTMTDSSGNGHNGTYTGTYTLNQTGLLFGNPNPSVDFAGAKGTITGASYMHAASITAEIIIKPDTVPGGSGYAFLVSRDVNGSNGPWWVALKGGKVSFLCITSGGITEFVGTTVLTASNTYHIACTYDGSNMRIYLNGVQDASTAKTGTLANNTVDFIVGNWPGANLPFDGKIDEVAFYGTALSSGRIAVHYAWVTSSPDASVIAPAATATSAGLTPTVAAGSSVAPPVASATAAGAVPVVTGTGDVTILAPTASASAAGVAPSLLADASLDAPTATASAAGLVPTVTATSSATVTAPSATASAGAIAPFVFSGSPDATVEAPAAIAMAAARVPGIARDLATDSANALGGRSRDGFGAVTVTVPVVAPIGTATARVDKAIALPLPTLVKGRPT